MMGPVKSGESVEVENVSVIKLQFPLRRSGTEASREPICRPCSTII